jgi:hypothetical protein
MFSGKRWRVLGVAPFLVLVVSVAGCGGTQTTTTTVTKTTTSTVTETVNTQAPTFDHGSPAVVTYFGVPVSATAGKLPQRCAGTRCHSQQGYVLVVKPEFFLTGATATAAAHGSACGLTCPGVPNDYAVIPAGTANLTFALPNKTKGTVVVQTTNWKNQQITAAQFAALIGGATSPQLFLPLSGGVWFAVANDTVIGFAQQYRP